MAASKPNKTALGLKLAKRVWNGLAHAGIFAPAQVTLEHQHLAHRYIVRGVEAGGAVAEVGHYVTFAAENGGQLAYHHPLDAIGVNGVHAAVLAPVLVRVELFRAGHSYHLLITKHQPGLVKDGRRPALETKVLFHGDDGRLELDLCKGERKLAGSITPQFYSRAGELLDTPAMFEAAVKAATAGVSCIGCWHSHYLVAPETTTAVSDQAGIDNGHRKTILPLPALGIQEIRQ